MKIKEGGKRKAVENREKKFPGERFCGKPNFVSFLAFSLFFAVLWIMKEMRIEMAKVDFSFNPS